MRVIGLLGILAALALGAALGFPYLETKRGLVSDYSANIERVHELQRLDAASIIATLHSAIGSQSNVDGQAKLQPRIRELKKALRSGELASTAMPPSLNNQLMRFLTLLDTKQETIERFKTQYAVVRNSLNYLPQATGALARDARDGDQPELADTVTRIGNATTDFMHSPDQDTQTRLLGELEQLNSQLMEYPETLLGPTGDFMSHVRTLLLRKQPLDELLARVIDQQASAAGNELIDTYTAVQQQQNRLADQYRLGVLLAAVVAVGLLLLYAILLTAAAERRGRQLERTVAARLPEQAEDNRPRTEAQTPTNSNSANIMAAMIVREINTPLASIDSSLEALQSSTTKIQDLKGEFDTLTTQVADDPYLDAVKQRVSKFGDTVEQTWRNAMVDDMPDMLQDMHGGIDHIVKTMAGVRDFTCDDRSNWDWYQLNDCVENAVKMSSSKLPENVTIKTNLSKLPPIYGSASEMRLALLNLISNGVHAIQAGGRNKGAISITTRKERTGVSAQVLDNGSGMDPQTEAQIFEPFFTTKEIGEGTGLGLSIVKRIVDSHGGRLALKSVSGKGSNFKISLPRKPD